MLKARPRSAAHRREFEAGKLHFRNFSETSLGGMALKMFRFKSALLKAPWIARRVFSGVEFVSEELAKSSIRITLQNNDYPIDHFKGFFQAWMEYSGLKGEVAAEDLGEDGYSYLVQWSV